MIQDQSKVNKTNKNLIATKTLLQNRVQAEDFEGMLNITSSNRKFFLDLRPRGQSAESDADRRQRI